MPAKRLIHKNHVLITDRQHRIPNEPAGGEEQDVNSDVRTEKFGVAKIPGDEPVADDHV